MPPCHIGHQKWDTCGLVHGDDFGRVGSDKHLKNICAHVAANFGEGGTDGPKRQGRDASSQPEHQVNARSPTINYRSDHRHVEAH